MRHRRIQNCHSCAGRNRDYAVRADASHVPTIAFYYWGLITKLRPTKGTQWIPAFAGMTVMCGCVSQLYVYRATMDESNFKDPIPACAGMTRSGERSGDLCHILRVLRTDGIRENLKCRLAIIPPASGIIIGPVDSGTTIYLVHLVAIFGGCFVLL